MEKIKHKEFNKVITFLYNVDEEFSTKFEEMKRLIPEKLFEKLHEFDEYKYENKKYDYCFEITNEDGFLYVTITHSNKIYQLKINFWYLNAFIYTLLAEKGTIATLTTIEGDKVKVASFEAESRYDTELKNYEPKVDTYITRYDAEYKTNEEPQWTKQETKSFKIYEIAKILRTGLYNFTQQ